MIPIPTTDLSVDEIRLGVPETWLRSDREGMFARLRAERPVGFQAEAEVPGFLRGPGYWAITRHADVQQVSRDAETFVSGQGSNIPDLPVEMNEFFGSMINMDAPKHTKLRKLVNKGFTPRMVGRIEEQVRTQAREIVDSIADRGECEFVGDVASRLPLQLICDMLGIPPPDHRRILELTNVILGVGDPEYVTTMDGLMSAAVELFQYAQALGEDRLVRPRDDITTTLMQAEVDGDRLSAQEFGSFFILLVVAGNETTRNAISHGLKALTDHPEQRRIWLADFDGVAPTAIEEIVRWATPVIHFRRTATRDVEVGGTKIRAGEKVVMFYNSANRDERAIPDPYRFDVRRDPNDHVAFGAGGPHFCLGANLARREIKVMFEELFRRLPDIEASGPPDMLLSGFIHGIKRLPAKFTPTR